MAAPPARRLPPRARRPADGLRARLAEHGAGPRALDRLADLAGSLLGASAAQVSLISDVQTVAGAGAAASASGRRCPLRTPCAPSPPTPPTPWWWRTRRTTSGSPAPPGHQRCRRCLPRRSRVAGDGHVIGALCVYELEPTELDRRHTRVLELSPPGRGRARRGRAHTYESDQLVWHQAVDAAGIGAFDLDLATGAALGKTG